MRGGKILQGQHGQLCPMPPRGQAIEEPKGVPLELITLVTFRDTLSGSGGGGGEPDNSQEWFVR